MNLNQLHTVWAVVGASLFLLGCAGDRIPGATEHGKATRAAFSMQVAYPDANQRVQGAPELSGPAAKAGVDRYQRTFEVLAPTQDSRGAGTGQSGASGAPANPAAPPR